MTQEEESASAFVNLPISRKLTAAFAALVAIIFVNIAIICGIRVGLADQREGNAEGSRSSALALEHLTECFHVGENCVPGEFQRLD